METVMSEVSIVKFNTNAIRIVMKDDDPWFVASDVCAVLGLNNITMALKTLDDDEAALNIIEVRSENGVVQKREVNTINESGLYALILRSR
jgi:prophage antirepressor-like protein